MKRFLLLTSFLSPLVLAACSAPLTGQVTDEPVVDESFSSSAPSSDGPYLEFEEEETDDAVELHLNASGSAALP